MFLLKKFYILNRFIWSDYCFLLRPVPLVTPAKEVPRGVEASRVLRARLGHLDHEECKGTGAHVESEGPRALR